MCMIDGEMFFTVMKTHRLVILAPLYHITNNDSGLYDIMKVKQVDGSERMLVLWPVKYCTKASANLLSLTCKLLQGRKISSDHKKHCGRDHKW